MKKIEYRWMVIAVCFLMVMVCLGFCSSTKSLFLSPITEALGVDRGKFAINDSFRYAASALVNVFFGSLVARFGARKLIGAGFLSLIASMLTYAFAQNLFVFYLGGFLLGVGLSWTTTTMVGYVVNKWCREKKGTIMGAVLAANGLGGAIAVQVVSPVIDGGADGFGYRRAYLLIAAVLFAVGLLVVSLFRNEPKGHVAPSVGTVEKPSDKKEWEGLSYSQVLKTPYFYLMLLCVFFTGFVLQGTSGISAAHMKDVGIDAAYVATVVSVHSVFLAVFKFLSGWFYDRFGLRVTVAICSSAAIAVTFILAFLNSGLSGRILAMVYGILSSLALPLETVMLPIYAKALFGEKSFNKVMGLFVSATTVGFACGAPLMNLFFDRLHSYRLGLILCGCVMCGVLILLQIVIGVAKKTRLKLS